MKNTKYYFNVIHIVDYYVDYNAPAFSERRGIEK